MIDPNKLPTAAIHWSNINCRPEIMTVDLVLDGYALTRRYGKVLLSDLYDIDKEQEINALYLRFKELREEYIALASLAS
jgi:hypothetical protein